jgi:small conductance mechanosensitive channel
MINWIAKKIEKKGTWKKLDKTLTKTLENALKISAKCLVVICLVGYLGIDTSGITALITSLGVCVGLAVNGALENLAGGFLLLITRPFNIDDYIEVAGYAGTVEDIYITNTKIRTPDNKVVYIPNGTASTSCVVNYSAKEYRRVDLTFSISYSENFEKAKNAIWTVVEKNESIEADPAPTIRMSAHSASSIDICCKVWTKTANYWDTYFTLLEDVKKEFDNQQIEIPFEQLDVHVK